jgi:hypothetical protein
MAKNAPIDQKLRAWWFQRQGLDGGLEGATSGGVLARTGWARSVGGAGPYLTLFARAGLGREVVDRACADLQIHELPSARGCTYVVPAEDFAIALRVGQGDGDSAEIAMAKKYLAVTDKELDNLSRLVLESVAKQPLDPRELKDALGDAVRNLGPDGKKRGMTTTLPLVLGRLQNQGEIRRVPIDGRVDRQRYRYVRWENGPLKGDQLALDEAYTKLAERYFRWIGPATLTHFQWFSALGVKAAKGAIAPLGLVPLAESDDRLLFPDDLDALRTFKTPSKPQFALVGSLDGVALLRRDVPALIDAADAEKEVLADKAMAPVGGLADFYHHAILDRGRVVGFWDYDPAEEKIVWATFGKQPASLNKAIERTEKYVRDELGDARSFSLDSPESRTPRLEALRNAKW